MNKSIIFASALFFVSFAFDEVQFVKNFCEEKDSRIECRNFSFIEEDLKDFAERVFIISKATEVLINGDIKFLNEHLFEKFPDAESFELESNESVSYELRKPFERPKPIIFESRIRILIIGNSRVENLENSTSFHTLTELEIFKIALSKYKDFKTKLKIDDSLLEKNSKLKNLNIITSNIETITEGAFRNLEELETLILKNNHLSYFQPKTFQYQTNIKTLDISENLIKYLGLGSFWPSSLLVLNLSGNKVESITKNHLKNLSNLKSLDISYNAIRLLSRNAFASNTKIQTINLKNNQIDEIRAFRNLETLVDLDFSNNDVETLQGDLFSNCRSLKTLNLKNNTIRIIFSAFNPELISLDLSLNKIQYLQGFEFNGLTSLTHLDISDNVLRKMGAYIPAIKLGTFSDLESLIELRLNYNFLEIDDIFRTLLQNMGKLEKFHLNGNGEFNFEDDVFDDLVSLEYLNYER
ncbi:Tl.2 family protein [Megaselia abdita]